MSSFIIIFKYYNLDIIQYIIYMTVHIWCNKLHFYCSYQLWNNFKKFVALYIIHLYEIYENQEYMDILTHVKGHNNPTISQTLLLLNKLDYNAYYTVDEATKILNLINMIPLEKIEEKYVVIINIFQECVNINKYFNVS